MEFPGWTLEYAQSLDDWTVATVWGVIDGRNKAKAKRERDAARKAKRKGKH